MKGDVDKILSGLIFNKELNGCCFKQRSTVLGHEVERYRLHGKPVRLDDVDDDFL